MSGTLTAVVRDGTLTVDAPSNLVDGEHVELLILDPLPNLEPATDAEIVEFEQALDEWYAVADTYPNEWWEEFDRFLRENRLNFEERIDPLSLGHQHDLGVDQSPSNAGTQRKAGSEGT